jgi:hypothetical protein
MRHPPTLHVGASLLPKSGVISSARAVMSMAENTERKDAPPARHAARVSFSLELLASK